MKRNILSFIIIIGLLSCTICVSANAINQTADERVKKVADELLNQGKPLNIVLAIDVSSSIKEIDSHGKEVKYNNSVKIAKEFYELLKKSNNSEIKIGYVEWSNRTLDSSENLTLVDKNTYFEIKNVNHTGNTCLKIGLNSSINLLKQEMNEDAYNVVVLISDGNETCNVDGSKIVNCQNDKADLDLNGIYIYVIPVGPKINKSLLECLSKEIEPDPDPLPERNEIPNRKSDKSIESPFSIKMDSIGISKRDLYTNMSVSKSVTQGEYGPRITLKLMAPSLDALKANIVLALDSSGSMGDGGRSEYGESIREAIPDIMNTIETIMPSGNVAIMSWDNDIDFAYSPISNNNTSKTRLVPIRTAKNDINKKEIFLYSGYDYIPRFFRELFNINKSYPTNYYNCSETELTNLSVGLDAARSILDSNQEINDGTLKLILFLVGRSEYTPCNNNLIIKTKNEFCNIHTIGLGVKDNSLLHNELVHIAGDKNDLMGNETQYHYSAGSNVWDNAAIEKAIKDSMDQYYGRNLANGITIVDTIYPYLNYVPDRDDHKIEVKINGKIHEYNLYTKQNSDGSTTLTISLGDEYYMKPEDYIEVVFNTELNLSLPVDIIEKNVVDDYIINNNAITSSISYNWLGNGQSYSISLPKCDMQTLG